MRSRTYSATASVSRPTQVHPAHALQPVQLGQPSGHLVGTVRHGRAERRQHQQTGVGAGLHHVLQQGQGGQLSPVQVLQSDHERPVSCQRPEKPGDRVEQLPPRLRAPDRGGFVERTTVA